ncbi:MAG TPA: PDZ domain-containing protein [Thermoanaerobaculia bacterium]|nr:PDZ domain-containing protein [Thermoanaerobaculia bacterium]
MRTILSAAAVLALSLSSVATAAPAPFLQRPALSKEAIAFVYGGDIWTVPRAGGDARRLTSGAGIETDPVFSPDGSLLAFTGTYDGLADVFVMPAEGGMPRRLTTHPGVDEAVGFTPDGKRILFRSNRANATRFSRLYTVSVDGGFPEELPLPKAYEGSYSADGTQIAYVPPLPVFRIWKRYRGGTASPIWIAKLSDSSVTPIPREGSNDFAPMWLGDVVYFLSDRNGSYTLFSYDTRSKAVKQVLQNSGLDIKSASAGPGGIVYDQFGEIHLYDIASGAARKVDIRVAADLPGIRPHVAKVAKIVENAQLSPTGARAVFEARGEILTAPAEKGDVRNLTKTSDAAERDPAWSPDGKSIAYFSDASGEYRLHVATQNGAGPVRAFDLGEAPSFYYGPVWSPDSKKIAYTDKRLNLWVIDLASKANTKVDTDSYDAPERTFEPVFSPDSRFLAYTKRLVSHQHVVVVHALDTGKKIQVTDGLSDARYPAFDKKGELLFFTASTNVGLGTAWLDMSSMERPASRSVYMAVLKKGVASPLAPESDEEKAVKEEKAEKKEAGKGKGDGKEAEKKDDKPVEVTIDAEGLSQRILALPMPARNYTGLFASTAGKVLLLESPTLPDEQDGDEPASATVQRFDLEKKKTEKLVDGVKALAVSANGEKMLVKKGEDWSILGTGAPAKGDEGKLKADAMEVYVDPRAEWRQMYHEAFRLERDFFYDPHHHGMDLQAAEKRYAPYLESIASRRDFSLLLGEIFGDLTVGHLYITGGDEPEVKPTKVGLLGADFVVDKGRYRFSKVYDGENWNPKLKAPLTQPGVDVKAGEYLLAVDGKDLFGKDEVFSFFVNTVGRSVVLKVGPDPNGPGAREVTVVPIDNERGLRNRAWIEENRRAVDRLSGGRLAYVYLPNTGGDGYVAFNRYFFSQLGKEGVVVDERFNGGGSAADYIVDYLKRPLLSYWSTREGLDFTTPQNAIFGPKAMLINEEAGSGGDALPWYFHRLAIGPLIGKRTWGGLVGIYDYPRLVDGGRITAPRLAFWNPDGTWEVENRGVAPDIEVELDPALVRKGHDPQLEKAVDVLMKQLSEHPLARPKRPAYPEYHKGTK